MIKPIQLVVVATVQSQDLIFVIFNFYDNVRMPFKHFLNTYDQYVKIFRMHRNFSE